MSSYAYSGAAARKYQSEKGAMNNERLGQKQRLMQLQAVAEAHLTKTGKNKPAARPVEELLHALKVHQIELEMQNEELRLAQAALEESRDRYADLYDFAPVGYVTLTDADQISEINLAGAMLLGADRAQLKSRRFTTLVAAEDRDRWCLHFLHVLQSTAKQSIELAITRSDGTVFDAQLECMCQKVVPGGAGDRCGVDSISSDGSTGKALRPPGSLFGVRISLTDISERRRAEVALKESESLLKFALEGAGDGVWDWNIQTSEARYSRRWKEMLGFAESEIGNESSEWSKRVHPEDLPRVMTAIQAHIDGKTPTAMIEFRMQCKDGSWQWTLGRGMVVSRTSEGKPLRLVGTNADISERKHTEEALREQKEFFHLIAENIGDFIAVLDLEGRRLYSSPSYKQFFGGTRDLHGTDSFAEIYPQDQERVQQVFRETVQTGLGRQIHYRLMIADGDIREMESLGSVIRDGEGKVARVVVVSHDITERKQMEEEVHQLAFYDPLTRLPNRRLLNDRLGQVMAANKRSGCYGALMFLDLDNFKPLNDRHGHEAGDLLLIQAANRLSSCVREMDTVARFGGDEFVVVVSELDADKADSAAQATIIAEKIRVTLSEPYQLTVAHYGKIDPMVEHHCTASIGVTLFINQEPSQDDLLNWADAAMYQAKAAGRNSIRFYDPQA